MKRRWRQQDLAERGCVSRQAVSLLERGRIARLQVDVVLRIIAALGGNIDFVVRWQGGELDRLLNARHSAMHESVARFFLTLPGWIVAPEVSFAIRGERGVIDILAWHEETRTLLVIELKTDIVDVNELLGTLDRKQRLAPRIARDRGWHPQTVATWLIVAGSVVNRRRVAAHASVLRAALPADGRSIQGWLRKPTDPLRCLSFWSNDATANTKSGPTGSRRVRLPKSPKAPRGASVATAS
jgi:transcriptional regulator with XRE-family HTH domain